MSYTPARWQEKATALADGYERETGHAPPLCAVVKLLCHAQHESGCGDYLSGDWGATCVAWLSQGDHAKLESAGLGPGEPANLDAARRLLGPRPHAILVRDSMPASGGGQEWYYTWMYRPDPLPDLEARDAQAAQFFVRVVTHGHPATQTLLEDPGSSVAAYAAALYRAGYFVGTTGGARPPQKRVGPFTPPEQANVDAYTGALTRWLPDVTNALLDWEQPVQPRVTPVDPLIDGGDEGPPTPAA